MIGFSGNRIKGKQPGKIALKNQVLFIAFIIGIVSSLAAFILKNSVHYIHHLITNGFDQKEGNYLFLIFPILGIFLTVIIIRLFIKDDIGHGVSKILYAISKKQGRINRHNSWSSILASTITIGFGGSVGAEAPIVLTGAAIGSNLGKIFKLDHKTLILLIGCGSAGAIAGIFKAPVTGLVFTLEVLMLDLTMASLIPLLISAVTAASLSYYLMGPTVMFSFNLANSFNLATIPFVVVLGIISGLISLYFTRRVMATESLMKKITNPWYRILAGGFVLSMLIFLFPPLYGEGYNTITYLITGNIADVFDNSIFYSWQGNDWLILIYLLGILMFKVFATSTTTGAGGVGGIFAPTLFMGGISGFMIARFFNNLGFNINESNFTLIGMAGLMAGVMHAPLTAIFLIAEITSGYGLILPLMLVSVVSYLTIMYFEPHSIYHKRLAQKGQLLTHHKDKAVLTLMKLNSVIENDLETIGYDKMLGDLVKTISKSSRNIYPVIDNEQNLKGIVLLDDIRNIMFRPELYGRFKVRELMVQPPAYIQISSTMEEVMQTFEDTGAWNLPVVDEKKYIGFVSKAKIFNSYRKVLVHYSDE